VLRPLTLFETVNDAPLDTRITDRLKERQWAQHSASHQAPELNIELFGSEAGAVLRPLTLFETVNDAPLDTRITVPSTGNAFDAVADHFIACILDGVRCEAPLRHGLVVQRMMEGLLESAALGREIRQD